MSLYDNASLVMIPSGVKEDKLYSIKPTDGSGDFTFSRGSDIQATRVNASGLIEKAKENLALQSNTFNTTWVPSNSSVTSGQSGYDGSTDAWLLTKSAAYGSVYQTGIAVDNSSVYTFSAYMKAGTQNFGSLRFWTNNSGADFRVKYDLTTGAITTASANNGTRIDATATDVGSGWWRVSVTGLTGQTAATLNIYAGDTADTTGNIYIQDAQLNHGLIAQDYVETTTTAVVEGLTADLPRLDYSGGASCPSLLLEPSRTNLFIQSEYLNTSYSLNAGTTLTDNYGISPEGVQNATRYVGTGGSGFGRQYTLTNGADYTISVYVKSNTGATQYCRVIGDSSNISSDLEVTTEWTRVQYTWTSAGLANKTSGLFRDSSDNDIDILVYGMQLEEGSYPTSYIPTYGTAAVRGKDSANTTGVSSLIGSTEGTIYLEVSALVNDLSERRFALSNGTTGNVARVGFTNISNRILAVLYNGANQCVLSYSSADITQTNKIAFTYAANDFALYVNGESRSTDTSGTTFSANTLDEVHFNEGDGNGNESYGNFDQVLVFPTRLTNAELAALTTL